MSVRVRATVHSLLHNLQSWASEVEIVCDVTGLGSNDETDGCFTRPTRWELFAANDDGIMIRPVFLMHHAVNASDRSHVSRCIGTAKAS